MLRRNASRLRREKSLSQVECFFVVRAKKNISRPRWEVKQANGFTWFYRLPPY